MIWQFKLLIIVKCIITQHSSQCRILSFVIFVFYICHILSDFHHWLKQWFVRSYWNRCPFPSNSMQLTLKCLHIEVGIQRCIGIVNNFICQLTNWFPKCCNELLKQFLINISNGLAFPFFSSSFVFWETIAEDMSISACGKIVVRYIPTERWEFLDYRTYVSRCWSNGEAKNALVFVGSLHLWTFAHTTSWCIPQSIH